MPYINTIDINGTTYHLKNLTDGDYVVDLPELNKNDIFVLRGDVVDNLSSYQSNKPLSANQGRALNGKIDNFKSQLDVKDSELGNKISQLRIDMGENDSSTLNAAKTYTDNKSSEALTAANQYTNESCQAINETVTSLQGTVNDNKKSLDEDIAELTTLVGTKSSETLTAANKYTDNSCATINNTITNLKKTVQNNKSSADSGISDLRTYVDTTFVEKTKIVDNLTTDSSEQVLSAKQGKALDEKKVDKISGKGLSTNDYTTEEKNKLKAIAAEANKYVHPTYTAHSSGLYKITVDATGHVSSVTLVTKDDITALGIPAQDTVYTLPQATADEIGGVKIGSDYLAGTDDTAASTSALNSAYDELLSKIKTLENNYNALLVRVIALENQNSDITN